MLNLARGKHDAKIGEKEHPAIEARHRREQVKSNPTVQQAFAEWMASKRLGSPRKGGKPVRERTVKVLEDPFNLDIRPVIGLNKIGKLTPADIRACIERAQKRGSPGMAGHVYRGLRGLVMFAIGREYITGADPMRGIVNPSPYRPKVPNALNDAEIVQFLKLIEDSSFHPSNRGVIELQLLTGMRPGECRRLKWRQVDDENRVIHLPELDVKTGKPFIVHMSDATKRLLQSARMTSGSGEYVFPGRTGDKPLSDGATSYSLRRKWKQDSAKGVRTLKPHDLRKTFRTLLKRLNVDGDVAGLCLNHTEEHVLRRIYEGYDYWGEMVDARDRAGAQIDRLRKGSAAVLQLMRPRPAPLAA